MFDEVPKLAVASQSISDSEIKNPLENFAWNRSRADQAVREYQVIGFTFF